MLKYISFFPEVAALRLEKLDLTANQISSLPVELRVMDSLVELNLDHNPLVSPPSSVSDYPNCKAY